MQAEKQVTFDQLSPGCDVSFETSGGLWFGFLVRKKKMLFENEDFIKTALVGELHLPERISQQMHVNQVIPNTHLVGSESRLFSSLYCNRIVQYMNIVGFIPLSGMTQTFVDPIDTETYLQFTIPSVLRTYWTKRTETATDIPKIPRWRQLFSPLTKQIQPSITVNDWPGKKNGIQYEDIYNHLYVIFGLRVHYWMNEINGQITRLNRLNEPTEGVWDVVWELKDKQEHDLHVRLAALTYWALKLGLLPPSDVMYALKRRGLGFELPETGLQ